MFAERRRRKRGNATERVGLGTGRERWRRESKPADEEWREMCGFHVRMGLTA